ncbi:unnamed protein product [Moneuplotes crassus]|uniref:Uncharacterized protein n=1 Tax=Euplotes crassus TaxID=5936 RepID=A0AAD1Y0K4_EUPCR|nr:unnamed protein product [Moneuplotes crassus]
MHSAQTNADRFFLRNKIHPSWICSVFLPSCPKTLMILTQCEVYRRNFQLIQLGASWLIILLYINQIVAFRDTRMNALPYFIQFSTILTN